MSTNRQRELLTLAKRVASEYTSQPNLEAILLTGSVARGMTDDVSDIDLMLYYHTLPSAAEFEIIKQAAVATGGDIYGFDANEGLACYHFIDGIKVDFAHQSSVDIERKVADFLAKATVNDETTHIIMSGIAQGVALYGNEMLNSWQQRLTNLPTCYANDLICANLRFPPVAVVREMGVDRQDYALVYELLVASVSRLLNIWCGLNGTIPPGKIKGCDRVAETLRVVPRDVGKRLRRMWQAAPQSGVAIFYQLVAETLLLIEMVYPEIDTGFARGRLNLPLQKRASALTGASH